MTDVKRPVSNPLALAVLVLLYERPMHPYEMASTLRERRKEASIKLNYGSLYTVIEQLLREKFIAVREIVKEGRRPEKTVYELTSAGEAELIDWMGELVSSPMKEYPAFEAAISLLPVLPPEEVIGLLEIRIGLLQKTIDDIAHEEQLCREMKLPRLFSLESEYYKAITLAEFKFSKDLLSDLKRDTGRLRSGWSKMRKQLLAAKQPARKQQSPPHQSSKHEEKGEIAMEATAKKPYRGISMEGGIATWYAKTTKTDLNEFERLAQELAKDLPANSRVLEIAPGPGYLSVALAKLGNFKITGLDISQTFIRLASEYAKREGVVVRFIHGNASDIPFEDGFFDLIVCRAAFKNFSEPLRALNEMHRVLKPGGRALILDLRKDTSWSEIEAYVKRPGLGPVDVWFTKFTFKHLLLKRAYTQEQLNSLAAASDFKSCQILRTPIGMEVTLIRHEPVVERAA